MALYGQFLNLFGPFLEHKYIVSFILLYRLISFQMPFSVSFLSAFDIFFFISCSKRYGPFINFRRSLDPGPSKRKDYEADALTLMLRFLEFENDFFTTHN